MRWIATDTREWVPAPLQAADVALVVGKRGTGKSTFAKRLAGAEQDAGRSVLVLDPHDEYSRHGRACEAVELGPLRSRCTVDELLASPSLLDQPALSLAVVPEERSAEGLADAVTEVVALAEATGGLTLFLDEVGFYSELIASRLNVLATQSRHASMPLVLVAQRTVQIPKTARTQASALYSFRQTNRDDLKELSELVEDDTFAAAVKRLHRGRFLSWRET